jgi:hypothetical protein
MEYIKGSRKSLRELGHDEKWLQNVLYDDPSILGLGDLTVIERERSQPSGGRLDFLMSDPEEGVRYEVEVMLGRIDESHIIRTIEYWDIERTRFPQLEHRAVIVAEEITSRFFNVISILNRAVPIIAVQLDPIVVDSKVLLHFTKVLDISELYGGEEDAPSVQVDRTFWEKASNPDSMKLVDEILTLVTNGDESYKVTYNKHHIAVGNAIRNFAWLHPRKSASHVHMHVLMNGDERTDWVERLDKAGIFAGPRGNEMKVRLVKKELRSHSKLLQELFQACEERTKK